MKPILCLQVLTLAVHVYPDLIYVYLDGIKVKSCQSNFEDENLADDHLTENHKKYIPWKFICICRYPAAYTKSVKISYSYMMVKYSLIATIGVKLLRNNSC